MAPPRSGKACPPRSGKACTPRRRVRVTMQQRPSSPEEHTRYPSRSFTVVAVPARGSCGCAKLFLLLPFFSAARRARLPHPHSSRCRRAFFCTRIAASTRFDGVTATLGRFFGAGAAVSVAAIPTAPAQAARRGACIVRSLPQAQKFSGSTFPVVADGSTRRPRARLHAMSTASRFESDSRHESPRRVPKYRPSAGALRSRRAHVVAAALASIVILPVGYVAYCIATLPLHGGLVIEPTPSALIVEAADGQVFATRGVFKGDKLSAQDVPINLSRAIIAIEDRHFYEHGGFYLSALHVACDGSRYSFGERARGRKHDYSAACSHDLPFPGAHHQAQDPGGGPHALAGAPARERGDPVPLPQHRLFRRRCLWRGCGCEALLRQDRKGSFTQRSGDAGGASAGAFDARSDS